MPGGEVRALEDVEAEVIRFAIAHYRGQMSEVARRLQIGRSTLYRKLDALGDGGKSAEIALHSSNTQRENGAAAPAARCSQVTARQNWPQSPATVAGACCVASQFK